MPNAFVFSMDDLACEVMVGLSLVN